ncbi:hypothetical protein ADIARSV_3068 [Arcticibacter svalbardensis MN12-7]|uniref:Uncharacterized protein n=1 Tax=Arcticibacter svalbardensis MN12-7 TaxID=1150600 RepID=R9GPV6_9SPHI|nr:hypothetical protein ADIARSV_3068 [Arcticibacter svalbardensis MN12-7]
MLGGLFFSRAKAQDANLTVSLAALQSIKLNTATININFLTEADYANGKSSGVIADQIEVFSTGLFTVSVTASGPLSAGDSKNDIPLSALTLTPTLGSSFSTMTQQLYNTIAGTLYKDVPKALIKTSSGTFNAKFSVNYGILPGVGSVNLLNRPVGDYTTTLTYTISPD